MRDHSGAVLVNEGRSHSRRREERVLCELAERLSAHCADDGSQQDVAGVAVQKLFAGRKIEVPLPADHLDQLGLGENVLGLLAGERHRRQVVAHPAGVVQQVRDRQLRAGIVGEVGQVLRHRVTERELAVERQLCDRCRRELLGDRANVEDGMRVNRHRVLQAGEAKAPRVERLAGTHDAHGAPRRIAAHRRLEQRAGRPVGGAGGGAASSSRRAAQAAPARRLLVGAQCRFFRSSTSPS